VESQGLDLAERALNDAWIRHGTGGLLRNIGSFIPELLKERLGAGVDGRLDGGQVDIGLQHSAALIERNLDVEVVGKPGIADKAGLIALSERRIALLKGRNDLRKREPAAREQMRAAGNVEAVVEARETLAARSVANGQSAIRL